MKNLFFLLMLCLLFGLPMALTGQTIRKDYREFTTQERINYTTKAKTLEEEFLYEFGENHVVEFCSNTHSAPASFCPPGKNGELFLPWHRLVLLDFEKRLKQTHPHMSIPYWDWSTDNNASAPAFWDNTFLAESNFHWLDDRCLGTGSCAGGALPSPVDLNGILGLTTFWTNTIGLPQTTALDFSHRLEAWHELADQWVSPLLHSDASPVDPVFFLHHAMVDKLWQDWEDQNTGIQSVLPNGNVPLPLSSYTVYLNFFINSNHVVDSRALPAATTNVRGIDLWYASGGKVLLDGSNGNTFVASDVTTPYLYRYTVASALIPSTVDAGEIYVGDVKRNLGNTVIPDSKGGFKIAPGVTCDFRAGGAIVFFPGYEAVAGAISTAEIISTPYGFAPEDPDGETAERQADGSIESQVELSTPVFKCFPNPVMDHTTFEYTLETPAEVSLKILDMTGKNISSHALGEKVQGTHQFDWDAGILPKGLYFCRLEAGGRTQTLKMVVN